MMKEGELDDTQILDDMIEDLRLRAKSVEDNDEAGKLYDRLLKAISLRRRDRKTNKGKGFDLGLSN